MRSLGVLGATSFACDTGDSFPNPADNRQALLVWRKHGLRDSAAYQSALNILRSPEEVEAIQESARAGWESGYSTEEGSSPVLPSSFAT